MLSTRSKRVLEVALADRRATTEIAAAIDANGSGPAAHVNALGATANLSAVSATLSTGDTYTDADVKSAIDGAGNALRTEVEARLDAIEGKIDAVIAALIAAGMMAP